MLRRPAFDPARVELAKLQVRESIRRRNDQPQSVASREFAKLLYGPTHPFAREVSMESVARITRMYLIAFHGATFHPNGLLVGITGDFDKAAVLKALRDLFGDWPKGHITSIAFPRLDSPDDRQVRFVGKPISQTHLRAGLTFLERNRSRLSGLGCSQRYSRGWILSQSVIPRREDETRIGLFH